MFRQIKNIFIYCIILILLVAAALFYRQSFLVMLFLIMCLLPVCSVLFTKRAFRKLTAEITSASYQSEKGMTVPLTITLHNPTPFPFLHAECTLSILSPFYSGREHMVYVLPASAKKATPFVLPVTYAHCGLFQAKLLSIKVYDYLHLASFFKETDSHRQIIILPDSTTQVSYHPELYGEGFDEYETSIQRGNISSNVTDIREYQPGDRLQKVHWKLSAKIDKLMVKENEATSSHQFFVLLELYRDVSSPRLLDTAIEYAYSLSKELLAAQENFFFGFYSAGAGDFVTCPVRTEDDLVNALCEAFYETPYETENLGREIYENSGLIKGTLLQVTHKGVFNEISEKIG